MPCAMICLRCKQRGERYSRQVARDGGLRFSSKRIRIFAAKAAEVKKRAGRCIGELIEEDRKPGRLARQKGAGRRGKVVSSIRTVAHCLPFIPAPCIFAAAQKINIRHNYASSRLRCILPIVAILLQQSRESYAICSDMRQFGPPS